jgi:low affinity Fe/Cu permease
MLSARFLIFCFLGQALIGNTTTVEGLKIQAKLDENLYEAGIKVSDQALGSKQE